MYGAARQEALLQHPAVPMLSAARQELVKAADVAVGEDEGHSATLASRKLYVDKLAGTKQQTDGSVEADAAMPRVACEKTSAIRPASASQSVMLS